MLDDVYEFLVSINIIINMLENHYLSRRVKKADTIPMDSLFNIILANINKHVLLKELSAIGQQLEEGGVILLSGLLHEDFDDIDREALKNGLVITERMEKGNWICLKGRKKAT